jgi:hypothetical protein
MIRSSGERQASDEDGGGQQATQQVEGGAGVGGDESLSRAGPRRFPSARDRNLMGNNPQRYA